MWASCAARMAGQRVGLFMDYAPEVGEREVPDPYFGGGRGFEHAMDLIEQASRGLLEDVKRRHLGERV